MLDNCCNGTRNGRAYLLASLIGSRQTKLYELVKLIRRQISVDNFQLGDVPVHDALLTVREPTNDPTWCAVDTITH
jgi:hypothetical protein